MTDLSTRAKPFVVARSTAEAAALRGAVVTIGNFDGVHRGHRAGIAAACERARNAGRPAAVLTFEPHPRSFFAPDVPLFRLSDETAKLRLLAMTDLDGAIVLPFDTALASLPAERFIEDILVDGLAITSAMIGADFHFGKGRGGSPALLRAEGERRGFSVEVVPHFAVDGKPVSSGAVRAALKAGDLIEANTFLGYPWFVTGEVVHGEKRGRELGFPTANLRLSPACQLRHGIYAMRVAVGGKRYDAVASFGRRPMFDNGTVLLEIYLFDFTGDLYGQTIDAAFVAWIRDEQKFDTLDGLIAQMGEDSRIAREALHRDPGAFPELAPLREFR